MSAHPAPPPRPPAWLPIASMAMAMIVLVVHLGITVMETDRALVTFDSAEYAVAGRTTARLGRLATTFVLPHESVLPAEPPFPLILGHPLVPLANALAFRLGGEHGALTLVLPGLALVLLAGVVTALAGALGAGPGAAFAAACAVVLHPLVLRYASEGLTELPFTLALAAAALVLTVAPGRGRAFAFGLVLGMAHLARPVMVPLLPAWLLALALVAPAGRRWRAVAWALAAFAPFAGALATYKALAAGDAFADIARYNLLIGLDPRYTPLTVQCAVTLPQPLVFLRAHPAAFMGKLAHGLPGLLVTSFGQAGLLAPLALAGTGAGLARRERRGVALALTGSALLLALLVAASLPSRRYLVPLLPLEIAFGFAALDRIARRVGLGPPLLTALALALATVTSAWPTARDWRWAFTRHVRDRGEFTETEWRRAGAQIALRVPPGALIVSDAGAFVAWYADRPAVLLPQRPADLVTLARRLPVDALVLTDEWLLDQPGFEGWHAITGGGAAPDGWKAVAPVAAGRLHAVVLLRTR